MLTVDSKVDLDFVKINSLEKNAVKAFEMTADALLTDLKNAQVMPKDTGNLQNESTFVDYSQSKNGVITLSSSTPYARRLYFHPEYHFNRDDNKYAQGKWLRFWLPNGTRRNFCQKAFEEFYRRLCGL